MEYFKGFIIGTAGKCGVFVNLFAPPALSGFPHASQPLGTGVLSTALNLVSISITETSWPSVSQYAE